MPTSHTEPPGRRALALAAVVGACLVAALGLATDKASADYTASVQTGTLQLTGDGAADALAARADAHDARGRRQRHARLQPGPQHLHGGPRRRPRRRRHRQHPQRRHPADAVTVDGGAGNDTLHRRQRRRDLHRRQRQRPRRRQHRRRHRAAGHRQRPFQWDPGDGSDTVEGQGGNDALDFNGSNIGENIDVSANGSRVRLTRNVAAITMDLDGIERVERAHARRRRHGHRQRPRRHRPRHRSRRPQRSRRRRRRRTPTP